MTPTEMWLLLPGRCFVPLCTSITDTTSVIVYIFEILLYRSDFYVGN
jgi:hypothetical protein